MEQFFEVVLERRASQEQLVVEFVLTQHAEELHTATTIQMTGRETTESQVEYLCSALSGSAKNVHCNRL